MPSPSTHSTLLGTLLIAFIVAVGTANAVTPEDVRLTLLSGAAPVFFAGSTPRGAGRGRSPACTSPTSC
ncbi:hypothetical protein ACW23B_19510 [Streptomyces albidoflavus]